MSQMRTWINKKKSIQSFLSNACVTFNALLPMSLTQLVAIGKSSRGIKYRDNRDELKNSPDFSLTLGFENTPLYLPDTVKNVGYDFRMCFRHKKNWREGKIADTQKWPKSLIGTF